MTIPGHKLKESLSLIVRTPLVLVTFIFSCLAFGFSWAVNRLQAADLWVVTWAAGFPKIDTSPISAPDNITEPADPDGIPPKQYDPDRLPDLDEIVTVIGLCPDFWISGLRERLEDSTVGRQARAACDDQRLYAVLKPTKEENLKRIENVFRAMTPKQFEHAQQVSKEKFGF